MEYNKDVRPTVQHFSDSEDEAAETSWNPAVPSLAARATQASSVSKQAPRAPRPAHSSVSGTDKLIVGQHAAAS